jgi:tRNA (adenine22-N1)-methyltransferase
MKQIDNRITFLASLAKDSNTLLDVGCDHGLTTIKALKYFNVKNAIASDINPGPLKMAKYNIIKEGLIDRCKIILSDGLKNINDDFDTLIISGMGGLLINKILIESFDKIKNKKLIIQPNNEREDVRSYLTQNGFFIENEYAFYDKDIYYEIIIFNPGNKTYNEDELLYGPCLMKEKNEAFKKYYRIKRDNLVSSLSKMKDEKIRQEKKELCDKYSFLIGE